MDTIRVAVTGVGGGVGQSIVKCLQDRRFTVVGFDEHYLATGLYGVPIAYITPPPNDTNYISTLLRLCKRERCRFLFPSLDSDLLKLSQSASTFAVSGTTVIISSPEVVNIADDKYRTHEVLLNAGIAVPRTILLSDLPNSERSPRFPVVLKPRKGGSRSANVYIVHDDNELKCALTLADKKYEYVLQEWIDGPEYTCGTVSWDSRCQGIIVMRRTLRSGDTYKCFVERNPVIENAVRRVVHILKPRGALNVQLRLRNGVPVVFEINARCSGTTAARALAGFNEPRMIIDYLTNGKKVPVHIKEISVLRYWQELAIPNRRIQTLKSAGEFRNKRHPYL